LLYAVDNINNRQRK